MVEGVMIADVHRLADPKPTGSLRNCASTGGERNGSSSMRSRTATGFGTTS
jgi:hypothetical protein